MKRKFNRRGILRTGLAGAASCALAGCVSSGERERKNPNILFISVDDLNDWIEPLGGHPQAITPNLKRLAAQSVNFTRSYCASPACSPSRWALMSGQHTYTTGLYSNYQARAEIIKDQNPVTLPMYLSRNGYWSAGAGKIFHNGDPHPESWDAYFPSFEQDMPNFYWPRPGSTVNMPAFKHMYGCFDWAPIDLPDEKTGDYQCVDWAMHQLMQPHDKPFFLACGIYRPHLPWYVPQKYFDLFPLEEIQLPKVLKHDLDDVGPRVKDIAHRGNHYHDHVVQAGQWKKAVQGYLASIAYADAMVGHLLDALEKSAYAENTVVVLWSDHGWQLGEKEHWRKFALWENVLRSVMMIKVPPGASDVLKEGSVSGDCHQPTSLMDIYPTLVELCGLPPKKDLDGNSLVPLLRNPSKKWNYPAISTYDYSEFSIRTHRWRYTRYIDGSEELYDHEADGEEWKNLAGDPAYAGIIKKMARHIPKNPAPLLPTSKKLSAHHVPPFQSLEHYQQWKAEHP